jgi:hypothetical protein
MDPGSHVGFISQLPFDEPYRISVYLVFSSPGQWAFVMGKRPSSVRPSVSFSHLNLLLWNRWTDFKWQLRYTTTQLKDQMRHQHKKAFKGLIWRPSNRFQYSLEIYKHFLNIINVIKITTGYISTKLARNVHWMVLYQICFWCWFEIQHGCQGP